MTVDYKVVFNRKKKLNKRGKALIQIEVYQGGKRRYFSTGVHLTPKEFIDNSRTQRYTKDLSLNNKILDKINSLRGFEKEVRNTKKDFVLSDFTYFLNGVSIVRPQTFTAFVEEELETQKLKLEYVTWKQQHSCIKMFHEAIGSEIPFNRLDYSTINKFDSFLRAKGLAINTIKKRHVQLKKYINEAVKNKYLKADDNPYSNFKLQGAKSTRTSLTLQEVKAIEGLEIDSDVENQLSMYRDMFLFSVYTGLRISDVLKMKQENLHETKDGLMLNITITKNHKRNPKPPKNYPLSLLYNGKPEVLIRKYFRNDKKRIFYGSTGPKINKALKVISERCGITKHITFHVARHTFCNETSRVMPTTMVQYLAAHGSITTTQVYLHNNDDLLVESLKDTKWKQ